MIKWFRRKKDEEAPEGSEAPPPLDEKTSAPAAGAAEQADGGGAPAQAATATEAPAETVAEESARAEGAPEDTASGGAAAADAAAADAAAAESPKKGFFARLRDRLGKTKTALVDRVRSVIRLHGKVDEELLDAIEEILIQSDVGVQTTTKIVERMRKEGRKAASEGPEALLALFKDSIEQILHANNRAIDFGAARPMIVLVVGVNGTGKTTTIGKMAQTLVRDGKRVMMVAADTFRAAAVEQLAVWAGRTGAEIVRAPEGTDPASVVYDALERARENPPDVVMIDTAGRLHTKVNLMEELKKIVRVVKRHYPEAPHETILVLDATTGQNALNQVRLFHDACALTGLIMTKFDGTAKGGILIACKDEYGLPIFKVGIGEGAEDLRDFDPHDFVDALFSNGEADNGAG